MSHFLSFKLVAKLPLLSLGLGGVIRGTGREGVAWKAGRRETKSQSAHIRQ